MMSDIPTELFLEILRHVPVESLFTFRSVCKTWRRIIDDPNFPKHHFTRGIGGHWFFYRHDNSGKIFILSLADLIYCKRNGHTHWASAINLNTLPGDDCLRKLPAPSCNGFILLSSCMVLRIWNPFTGQSLELGLCHEFENLKVVHRPYIGIGYDEVNDDYKVVRVLGFKTYIYSVNSKMWRNVGDFPDSLVRHRTGVFAYGALHWVAYSREVNGELGWIVALDLRTGNYRKIALPTELAQENHRSLGLNALSGCLFLSCSQFEGGYFVMWKIKDYGSKDTWIEMVSLKDDYLITPLAYLESKEQFLLRCDDKWEYLWYDVGTEWAESLIVEVDADGFADESDCYEYIRDTFSCQVLHASLIRLERSDVWDESVDSQGTSKKKRKMTIAATERLPLEIFFGNPESSSEASSYDDGPTFSDDSGS